MNACNPKEDTIPGFDSMHAELTTQRQPTPLRLAPVGDKTVELDCDGGHLSSDAGLVLLKDIDDQLGLTRALAAVLADARDARRIPFTSEDIRKQRIFQIAAGYEVANDANTLRHAPIFKLLLDRLPETGAPLASPPTISRFENSVSRTEIYRMALVLMDQFIASDNSPPEVIGLDVDDTEDRAHGAQEQIRYDGYYGGDCFLPFHLYEGLSGRLNHDPQDSALQRCPTARGAQACGQAASARVARHLVHLSRCQSLCLSRGDGVDRSTTPTELCHRPHEQRGGAEAGSRGHRAGQAGLCVLGAKGYPLALDTRPSGHMVALAPCGHQGRGVGPRRQHALRRDGYGTSPPPSALSAHLLCPWPNGKRDQRPQAVPEIGAHVLSPLRGSSRALVLAFGGLCAP
jgi:Transposase DDE domain group 1